MSALKYAVHAYAWTTSWSNDSLHLIDHAAKLGFDLIEIPLMEIDKIDPVAIKNRLEAVGLGVCTSTVCNDASDLTAEDDAVRAAGVDYLKQCVDAAAGMGASTVSGVIYSSLGRKIDGMPGQEYWDRSAAGLKEVARYAADKAVTIGIEPINRYETFLVNTCDQAIRLADMIGESNVAIHLDAYHMNIEETDFYEPTRKAADRLCHYHLSESHRGTPGTGTVDWRQIYQALADAGYAGVVGLESFSQVSDAMRAATCVWRPLAPSSDYLLENGLAYLRNLEQELF